MAALPDEPSVADALRWAGMRLRACLLAAISMGGLAVACGGSDQPGRVTPEGYCGDQTASLLAAAGDPVDPAEPISEDAVPGSACNAVVRAYAIEDSTHVPVCNPVSYSTNPPSSGHHYPLFPKFGVYQTAIPRGFWVHSLEHGGVVLTYSCKDCRDEVRAATELVQSIDVEASCCTSAGCGDSTNRTTLTPDSGLDTRWAASAWGFTLTADCFEQDVFEAFVRDHRGLAPENICSNSFATDVTRSAT